LDCEMFNDLHNGDIVDSVMLCAGVSGGAKDFCEGDSYGPISIGKARRLEWW
jgi:hypothetical protein